MDLFHDAIAIVHLADGDRRAVLRMNTLEDGSIGVVAIHRAVRADAMAANGFWAGSA